MNAGLHWPRLVTREIGVDNTPFKGKKIKILLLRHFCTNNAQSHAVKSKKAGNLPPYVSLPAILRIVMFNEFALFSLILTINGETAIRAGACPAPHLEMGHQFQGQMLLYRRQ